MTLAQDAQFSSGAFHAENSNREKFAGFSAAAGVSTRHLLQLLLALFIAPNALLASRLGLLAGVPIALGCAGALWLTFTIRPAAGSLLAAPIDAKLLGLCALLALALCALGGEAHFFYAAPDWLVRDSLIADLVGNGYPVAYRLEGQDYVLRAPLAIYAVPALLGRVLVLFAAHLTLLAQNALTLSILLYFLARLSETRALPFLALFVLFSGMDILPILYREAVSLYSGGEFLPFAHIEWWSEKLQYSSHLTQLFWAPNHMLPGWGFALLILLHVRREIGLEILIAAFAAMLFWSPLAMLGALPFLACFGLADLGPKLFAQRNLIAAGAAALFLPAAIFLTIDAGEVDHGFLIGDEGFAALYLLFLAVEIPQAGVIAAAWDKVDSRDRRMLMLAILLLAILPIYKFGGNNDLVMRASIPPLFLLAFSFSRIAVLTPRGSGWLATSISMIVIVGAATPLLELKSALNPAWAISDCNFLTTWSKTDPTVRPTNYLARAEKIPAWLTRAGDSRLMIEKRQCWPGHPLLDDTRK